MPAGRGACGYADRRRPRRPIPRGVAPGRPGHDPGREVRRPAVPADDMMQAFSYHHFVPAQQWLVAVVERGPAGAPETWRASGR